MFPRPVPTVFTLLAALCLTTAALAQTPTPPEGPLQRALRESPLHRSTTPAPADARTTARSDRAAGITSVTAPGRVLRQPAAAAPGIMMAPPPVSVDGRKAPVTQGGLGDGFGTSFTTFGDLQNDGVSDVAIGAPYILNPSSTTGAVFIYLQNPAGGTVQTLLSNQVNSSFGFSVAGVGDVNGDGYGDLLVGAPNYNPGSHPNAGQASLYLGNSFGFGAAPSWTFTTNEDGAGVGYAVAWAGDVNRDGYDDWIVGAPYHTNGEINEGAVYLFFGGAGALPATPAWTQESDQSEAAMGYCVSTAGDVNADGYADILVGTPGTTDSYINEGSVALFMGAPGGPTHFPARTWFGGQAGAELGISVATAGDVNGDGFCDFIAGAPYFSQGETNEGVAFVYQGAALPVLIGTPTTLQSNVANSEFGSAVGTAGDINGDGYADVVVGAPSIPQTHGAGAAYVYYGSDFGTSASSSDQLDSQLDNSRMGVAVGTLGDIDGDGRSDWAAGSPTFNGSGLVSFRNGSLIFTSYDFFAAQGLVANRQWGLVGATLDSDGDGYDDLAMGSIAGGSDTPYRGTLSLFRGSPHPFPSAGGYPFLGATPDWTYEGATPGDGVGCSLVNAGDVNGDGYEDLLTGGYGYTGGEASEGEALLFYGSSSGLVGTPVWQTEGNQTNAIYGYSVAGGGDLNGDGFDDVAVGAPQANLGQASEGSVSVYQGSALGLSHTPVVTLHSNQGNAVFGVSCAIPGDVNQDGYDDLVVGAPYFNDGSLQEGAVFLYFGSPTGIHAPAAQELQINVTDARLGWSVARIGDVNGDGFADLAVGAPGFTDGESQEGRVLVYYGSVTGFVTPATWTLDGNEVDAQIGYLGLGGAGDFNGDGYGDVIVGEPVLDAGGVDAGRILLFPGGPTGLGTSPILDIISGYAGIELGAAVGGMADFNGDGASDLYYSAPQFDLAYPNEGAAIVRVGNTYDTWNANWPVAAWRTDGTAPIVPGQRSNSTTGFNLHATARSAAGRTRLKLEYEVKPQNTPFNFAGRGASAWQNTGGVLPGAGSKATVNAAVTGLLPATRYHWRARYRSASPLFPSSPWFGDERVGSTERMLSTAGGLLPVSVDPALAAPGPLALAGAAPNPFTQSAALAFTLPRAGRAVLALYDVHGRLVRTVFDGAAPAGRTAAAWDGRDADGHSAPAGAYFTRLVFEGEEKVGKIVRLR